MNSNAVKELIAKIQEHESQEAFALKTNQKELPQLNALASNPENFKFAPEDKDLEKRMIALSTKISSLDASSLSNELLESLKKESSSILETLVLRYTERLEAHASRQGII